jgi:uncharacterized OsmC-like protein
MALVDRQKLRANYDGLVTTLREDPSAGFVHPSVTARLVADVTVESTFVQYERPFRFVSDEADHRAGGEQGPSPMRYFLSGLAFCLEGWYAKGSAVVECDLEDLQLEIRTFMDMRGEHGFPGVPPHPQWIVAEARVRSPAPSEAVLEMIDWGDARCPLVSLVRTAIPVYERVVHNGAVVRNTVPPGLP